ncbi:MAG: lipoyl synthase [Planctomycetes bacterium]|nr:lipoyl synthase [Planctomycetota bacterium]
MDVARPTALAQPGLHRRAELPSHVSGDTRHRKRLPPWLKKAIPRPGKTAEVNRILDELQLATVCTSAHCPNRTECFSQGTATFMILGTRCTRNCGFCAVESAPPQPPRADEPQAVAEASERLGLRHVVITSVTRDDLADGGAEHFARTIRSVHQRVASATVEVLVPDFQLNASAIDTVLAAGPDVFNHNLETVRRLHPIVRPQADYRRSLDVLAYVSQRAHLTPNGRIYTKSGLMAGLGEDPAEIVQAMRDLRAVNCNVLTIGQYLRPSAEHVPVDRFIRPEQFERWSAAGKAMGFEHVWAGPFVRSSYKAGRLFAP